MVSRREFLGITLGAGATLALTPQLLGALQQSSGTLIQRAIPSSGERLPAVGLSFSNHPSCADHAALREVLRTFADNGGTVFDAMHVSNPVSDQFHTMAPNELGIQDKLFWSTRGTPGGVAPQPGAAFVNRHIDTMLARIKARRIDLVMLPAHGDPTWLAALGEEKKAGRVRYIGVQAIADPVYPQLESVMRNEQIDFIGVDYDVGNRARVEDRILPLAQERKIAVMAFFPFGNNGGISCGSGLNLFGRVGTRPLPEWAAEFDARTWAQFFLKYVISHPAITVARVGTTKAHHMLDNIGGGIGRLPDEATRTRMAAFIDALPPVAPVGGQAPQGSPWIVLPAATLDRYVGEYRTAAGTSLTVRRYGSMLVVVGDRELVRGSSGSSLPETVIYARSETRFSVSQLGPNFVEFQLDGAGTVTGLVLEQGSSQKIPASRIR